MAAVSESSDTSHAALWWENWISSQAELHPYWVCSTVSHNEHMYLAYGQVYNA
jgi:hypothetical protein